MFSKRPTCSSTISFFVLWRQNCFRKTWKCFINIFVYHNLGKLQTIDKMHCMSWHLDPTIFLHTNLQNSICCNLLLLFWHSPLPFSSHQLTPLGSSSHKLAIIINILPNIARVRDMCSSRTSYTENHLYMRLILTYCAKIG